MSKPSAMDEDFEGEYSTEYQNNAELQTGPDGRANRNMINNQQGSFLSQQRNGANGQHHLNNCTNPHGRRSKMQHVR